MTMRNFVPVIIVAGSLFAGIGMTAFAIDNPQGSATTGESSDAMLNDKVETLLRTDIGLVRQSFPGAHQRRRGDRGWIRARRKLAAARPGSGQRDQGRAGNPQRHGGRVPKVAAEGESGRIWKGLVKLFPGLPGALPRQLYRPL